MFPGNVPKSEATLWLNDHYSLFDSYICCVCVCKNKRHFDTLVRLPASLRRLATIYKDVTLPEVNKNVTKVLIFFPLVVIYL